MITVKAIFDENNTASPSEIVETNYGSLFNGNEFIYFENNEERIEYLKSLDTLNGSN